eukprot:symbB.v1.2.030370.t1/scaffold3260.1/size60085/2
MQVGDSITLADISVCCALVDGMKHVFDGKYLKPFPNLLRWFALCVNQPEFKKILGEVKIPSGEADAQEKASPGTDVLFSTFLQAGKAPTKDAPKKEAAKEAPKKDAAPKKEAAPKQDAAPKKEGKQEKKKDKDAKKEEAPAKELTPEEIEKQKKDKLKKVIKEGGKRGVEIEGAADMGGLQFFCTSVDQPEGDLELLEQCVEAMNAKSDPGIGIVTERKGGSGHIGKMVFSVGVDHLAVVAYVPPEKQKDLACEEWLGAVLATQGGAVVMKGASISTGKVQTNADKGVFPLKIREPMIIEANNYLRKKGLFPEDNDDEDDEFVFGDDDFPS